MDSNLKTNLNEVVKQRYRNNDGNKYRRTVTDDRNGANHLSYITQILQTKSCIQKNNYQISVKIQEDELV